MRMRIHIPLLAAAALLLHGCSSDLLVRTVDQGVIEYALSFPDYDPNGLMAGMLPERTLVTFTKDRQVVELSAGMGVFRTAMITDSRQRAMDYHLAILSKKLVAHMSEREVRQLDEGTPVLTILHTPDRDTIAGYPCRKAIALFADMGQPEIDLWYTDRIGVEDPNWFGPFADIPGMLLRYEVEQYGMRMRLDAVNVKPGPVDEAKFAVKKDHEPVEPAVLQHEMEEVLSIFTL